MKISVLKSHNQVERYFSGYYAGAGETAHRLEWGGELAREMGLNGEVDRAVFADMLKGNFPTGEHVNSRKRCGYDLTYSLDKSVSCLIAYSDNEQLKNALISAFKDEHRKSMSELEKDICEQKFNSENRTNSFRKTGNAAWASVLHPTNRLGEPQLHIHTVLLNATRNDQGKLKALELEGLAYKSGLAHEQIRKRIENVLFEHGIVCERDRKTGEIVIPGLDKEFLDSKSTRSRQIESYLQKNFGLSYEQATEKQREQAALKSRATKKEETVEAAFERFKSDIEARGIVERALTTPAPEKSVKGPKEAVSFAVEKLIEREGAFGTHKLIIEASRTAGPSVSLDQIKEEIKNRITAGELIAGRNARKEWLPQFATTPGQLEREKRIFDFVSAGRNTKEAVLDRFELADFLEKNKTFSEEQRRAATMLLTTKDNVCAIQGVAGGGKTFLLAPVVESMQNKGLSVVGLGPSWAAVSALQEAGATGQTLQGFIANAKNREGLLPGKTVLILDESSLADTKSIESLCAIAKKNDFRLVFQGDSRQLESVEAGGVFSYLQKSEALETARIETSMRQKNADREMREAVLLARDNPERSIKKLEDIGKIHTTLLPKTIAKEKYLENRETLILTNTNSLKNSINNEIKAELVERGELKNGVEITTFKSATLTTVEKPEAVAGQYFKAERDYKSLNIEKGELFKIIENKNGVLTLENEEKNVVFDTHKNKKFDIGTVKKETFYEGEKIELNSNDYIRNGLKNRDNVFISKIENGEIYFKKNEHAKELKMNIERNKSMDISSGYAKTVHSSQGLTVDRAVFIADSRVDNRVFMVAATRIKSDLEVYTDNVERLKQSVKFTQDKQVALEVEQKTIEKEKTKVEIKTPQKEIVIKQKPKEKSISVPDLDFGL